MTMQRILAVVLVVVGVTLFIVGMNASDSITDRLSNFFTGRFTDATVWYLIGGAAAVVGGLLLATIGRRGVLG